MEDVVGWVERDVVGHAGGGVRVRESLRERDNVWIEEEEV